MQFCKLAKQQKLIFGCYLLSHAISYTFTQVHILVDQSRIRKLDEVISEQVDGCPKFVLNDRILKQMFKWL